MHPAQSPKANSRNTQFQQPPTPLQIVKKNDAAIADESSHWWRHISLKPYQELLLTPGAAFWIFCVRLAMSIMAIAEGVSWGYLGAILGGANSYLSYFTGLAAGLSVLIIIWILDSSFMTLDTAHSYYERLLSPRMGNQEENEIDDDDDASGDKENDSPWSKIKQLAKLGKMKGAFGVGIRLAIVLSSLYFSAPFLSQLVFYKDISSEIVSANSNNVVEARKLIEQKFDNRIDELKQRLSSLQKDVIQESAGSLKSGTGRRGNGPQVEIMEKRLEEVKSQLLSEEKARSQELTGFDTASPELLTKKYGVRLKNEGYEARNEALKKIQSKPEFSKADGAVKAFLLMLFLALIALKVFQPKSIRIYYNEQLQGLFGAYRNREFDEIITSERVKAANGTLMSPIRFEEWCLESYKRRKEAERRENELQERLHKFDRDSEFIRRTIQHLENNIKTKRGEVSSLLTAFNQANSLLAEYSASAEMAMDGSITHF